MKNAIKTLIIILLAATASCRKVAPPEPYGACPTSEQVEWQKMEMNMFCHFGPNTFTDMEWGDGTEGEDLFNPTNMDCSQWAETARKAGMKGIILTAKHHDGFCLWPNPESSHTVAQSSWREGKGDVVRELSDACSKAGLRMGLYISPWDRNAPTYGSPEYNTTFKRTLEDALSRYGKVFEQWFDGANGEGPNGKRQTYDWELFNTTVARLQPEAVIFSDVGPGCRWVGNENGEAGETCWSTLESEGYTPGAGAPPTERLTTGDKDGSRWIPAETDVSIRNGWFWHQDEEPKSVEELMRIYYSSVGRNSLLLLNVPPDRRGRIDAKDSVRLMEFRAEIDRIFGNDLAKGAKTTASDTRGGQRNRMYAASNLLDDDYDSYWATDDSVLTPTLMLKLREKCTLNKVMLQEYIPLGQRVEEFAIDFMTDDGRWEELARGTTIGYKRIVPTRTIETQELRIRIVKSAACPVMNKIGVYCE